MSRTSSHTFHRLLQDVSDQHERELAIVRAQVAALHAKQSVVSDSGVTSETVFPRSSVNADSQPDNNEVGREHVAVCVPPRMFRSGMQDTRRIPRGCSGAGSALVPGCEDAAVSISSDAFVNKDIEQYLLEARAAEDSSEDDIPRLKASQSMDLVFPGCYTIRPVFEKAKRTRKNSLSQSEARQLVRAVSQLTRVTANDHEIDNTACTERIIMPPNSRRRLFWDFIGMLALIYDMLMVPLQAFDLRKSVATTVIDWITRIFWSLDMPASLLVGYYRKGQLVMVPKRIATHYLKTFFLLDLVVVGGDWFLFFLESGTSANDARGVVRLLRVARFARIFRLLRLLKFRRFLQDIEDMINTETLTSYFRIVKPAVIILFVNHLVACVWWQIGTLNKDGNHWPHKYDIAGNSFLWQYSTSLHWSFSMFTVGSMDVHPTNEIERVFTISVMCMGLTMFSSMVGSTTSAIESLRELRTDETRQFILLRRFLRDYHVSKGLTHRINRFAEYAYQHRKSRLEERSVGLLALLSDQLHNELQFEMHMPHLSVHLLFERMAALPANAMEKACRDSLFMKVLARHDVLFHAGEHGHKMFFVTEGELLYRPHECLKGASPSSFGVEGGDWVAEATLWSPWLYLGVLQAQTESRLVAIDADMFGEAMKHIGNDTWLFTHAYAVTFVQQMNELAVEQFTDLLQLVISPEDTLKQADCLGYQLRAEWDVSPRSPKSAKKDVSKQPLH